MIWIGISLFGSIVVCNAGGPLWVCDDEVAGSFLMLVVLVATILFFGIVGASGGTCEIPLAPPFNTALFFCSAANAFFDLAPFD